MAYYPPAYGLPLSVESETKQYQQWVMDPREEAAQSLLTLLESPLLTKRSVQWSVLYDHIRTYYASFDGPTELIQQITAAIGQASYQPLQFVLRKPAVLDSRALANLAACLQILLYRHFTYFTDKVDSLVVNDNLVLTPRIQGKLCYSNTSQYNLIVATIGSLEELVGYQPLVNPADGLIPAASYLVWVALAQEPFRSDSTLLSTIVNRRDIPCLPPDSSMNIADYLALTITMQGNVTSLLAAGVFAYPVSLASLYAQELALAFNLLKLTPVAIPAADSVTKQQLFLRGDALHDQEWLQQAVQRLAERKIPLLTFTGSWAAELAPTLENIAWLQYAACRSLVNLPFSSLLLKYVAEVTVFTDLTVCVPYLGHLPAYREQLVTYSRLTSKWVQRANNFLQAIALRLLLSRERPASAYLAYSLRGTWFVAGEVAPPSLPNDLTPAYQILASYYNSSSEATTLAPLVGPQVILWSGLYTLANVPGLLPPPSTGESSLSDWGLFWQATTGELSLAA